MQPPTSFIARIWTTDPQGICTSAVDHEPDLLPPLMPGASLPDWLRGCGPDGADAARFVADALVRRARFDHEVQVRGGDGTARRIVVSGLQKVQAGAPAKAVPWKPEQAPGTASGATPAPQK